MSSASIREPASFGKRKEPHTIVVMRDGKSRQFTINPALFSVLAGTLFMFPVRVFWRNCIPDFSR